MNLTHSRYVMILNSQHCTEVIALVSLYPWRCSCLSFGAFCPIFVLPGSAIISLGLWWRLFDTTFLYTTTKQNRAFSAAGPSIWNGVPFALRSLARDFSSSFYSLLKTFLFARAWAGSASE